MTAATTTGGPHPAGGRAVPETRTVIPELDQPPTRFTAILPAARIEQDVLASGARYGCWILRSSSGSDAGDEPEWHFDDQVEAAAELADILDGYEAGEKHPDLTITQLPLACFTLSCAACGKTLDDEELGYGTVHFKSLAGVERFAENEDWTTDGQWWNCETCPPLECPPGWRAGI